MGRVAQDKFKPGNQVRNVNPLSAFYDQIQDRVGIYRGAWDVRYTLHRPCDVEYPGIGVLAQSEDDLAHVPIKRPDNKLEPFNLVVDGKLMRVRAVWQTCGHKEKKDERYNRCLQCYPLSGKVYATHGPYYYGFWKDEQGKTQRVYFGRELPLQDNRKEA
jgi:hypothetical protein